MVRTKHSSADESEQPNGKRTATAVRPSSINEGPMTHSGDDDFDFSVDLLRSAKEHIFFLQHLHPLFIQRPSHKSLQRYRDLWLPLVSLQPNLQLVPPPDVAWLWHCHRLAPFRYTSYLKSTYYGRTCKILEATPPFCFQQLDGKVCIAGEEKEDESTTLMSEKTRDRWNQMYPNEPFFLVEAKPTASGYQYEEEEKIVSLLDGFHLLASTDRQATFLWQVSGPRFSDDDFLQDAISQYYKFLKLRRPGTCSMVLVPTYQIDLMWHSHILATIAGYYMDCKAIMGSTLNHDDSLNDRTEDGPLDRAFKETKSLWEKSYGEDYFAEGGMYRGEPPEDYYSPSWKAPPYLQMCPTGLFLHLVGIQGASSTNPSGDAYDLKMIWTWKETSSQIPHHSPNEVVGDPTDCWIKYDDSTNIALEAEFQGQGSLGTYNLGNGYYVDFAAMKQTNTATGYQRDVKRHVYVGSTIVKPTFFCWKESPSQMSNHPASSIFGDPGNCWIKYDDATTAKLESAFLLGQDGEFSPIDGYMVNFTTMKQKNLSTGYQRDIQRVYAHASSTSVVSSTLVTPSCSEQPIWCCISDNRTAPDGLPAFVTAKAKSTTRGVNANTYKPNYIFGKKSGKTGYYHITTKEAYQIVAARIGVRLKGKEGMLSCCTCLTLGLCGKSSLLKNMKSEVQKLKDIQAIANARASATTPTGIVGLRLEIQNDQSKRREHYSDAGDWYFPTAYYNAAGGCGAGTVHGGGSTSLGGGCGATACGAAVSCIQDYVFSCLSCFLMVTIGIFFHFLGLRCRKLWRRRYE
mmetsp:Transcript_17668/g.32082  ORF Transcript_17668/g.32082 Transcript_17668/m.32082 type:complete len:797 (+) Transcript_17668:286-2676(+)